jgi:hypothetical protein
MRESLRTSARLLLASIRLLNGSIALCLPGLITRQLGTVAEEQPATQYALRMFGIRTILLAFDLLRPAGAVRDQAIRMAPIIHAADTIAASLAARSRSIPARAGRAIITISAINTLLSLVMQPHWRR